MQWLRVTYHLTGGPDPIKVERARFQDRHRPVHGVAHPLRRLSRGARDRMTHRMLLDVSSLTYRAYFAMKEPGCSRRTGVRSGAVHGYLDMVTRLIVDRRPDEVVHVYDHDWRPVARTDIYPGYKADAPARARGPDRSSSRCCGGARPHRHAPGADRGLGGRGRDRRVLRRGERRRPDRDRLRRPRPDPARPRPGREAALHRARRLASSRSTTRRACWRSTACRPPATAEFAILRGDPSDGLPGVRGVGEKTARDSCWRSPRSTRCSRPRPTGDHRRSSPRSA